MNRMRAVSKELWNLVVDDGSLAFAILAMTAAAGLAIVAIPASAPWAGPVLAVGLAGVLVENVVRRARAAG